MATEASRDETRCPVMAGYDPFSPKELRDPLPSFARARREEPVFYSEVTGHWTVTRREDILAVIKDTERFSSSHALPLPETPLEVRDRLPFYPSSRSVLFKDNPEHGPMRKQIQAPFTPRRLRRLEPFIRTRCEELLDRSERRIEFVEEFAIPLAISVIGKILGVASQHFPMLEETVADAFRLSGGAVKEPADVMEVAESQAVYWEFVQELIEERRAREADDFTSVLVREPTADGTMPSTTEVAVQVNAILVAGFETSAQAMTVAVQGMLNHRDQWERLQADRDLVESAVEETLRHRTVVKRIYRLTTTDVMVGGVSIPEGSMLALLLPSANHDEDFYDEPERFDIGRSKDNIAFGRWRHFCVGAPLARIEIRIMLEALLDLAPDAEVVPGQELRHRPDMRIDQLRELWVDLGS